MLSMKKVKLELTSDADMYVLFEKMYERWSLLHIYIYNKANNNYSKSYDWKQE